jgi:hypothetical protein
LGPRRSLGVGGTGRSSIPETAVLIFDASGILGAPVKPGHDSGGDVAPHSRGTMCPSSAKHRALEVEGAGNAGCRHAPAGLACKGRKRRTQVFTGTPNSRHSLRDGLRRMARSPRGPGFDSPRHPAKCFAGLGLGVGRPGPRALTRPYRARFVWREPTRPPHPAPTFVTIAIRPSSGGGMRGENHIFRKNGSGIFGRKGATRQIGLIRNTNLVFGRARLRTPERNRKRGLTRKSRR